MLQGLLYALRLCNRRKRAGRVGWGGGGGVGGGGGLLTPDIELMYSKYTLYKSGQRYRKVGDNLTKEMLGEALQDLFQIREAEVCGILP